MTVSITVAFLNGKGEALFRQIDDTMPFFLSSHFISINKWNKVLSTPVAVAQINYHKPDIKLLYINIRREL